MAERHTSALESIPLLVRLESPLMKTIEKFAEQRAARATEAQRAALKGSNAILKRLAALKLSSHSQNKWIARYLAKSVEAEKAATSLRRTGRLLNPKLAKTVKGVGLGIGAVVTVYEQARESTATTTWGKGVDAVAAAAADVGIAVSPVGLVDTGLYVAESALGIDPKGLTVGDNVNTGIRGWVTIAEYGVTGDARGITEFDEKARHGDYGPPAKAISNAAYAVGYDVSSKGLGATVGDNLGFWGQYAAATWHSWTH
jgi:hypothetical protein